VKEQSFGIGAQKTKSEDTNELISPEAIKKLSGKSTGWIE